jgi:hypothetical protein
MHLCQHKKLLNTKLQLKKVSLCRGTDSTALIDISSSREPEKS